MVILGAFYVRANQQQTAAGAIVVTQAPVREYINTTDSDGDGVKDWEEDLQANLFEAIDPISDDASTTSEPYEPPTTFTGKFSEAFLQDYLGSKMALGDPEATLTDEQKLGMVGDAVKAIEANTKSKRYTQLDINIVPNDLESMRDYGNRITAIILAQPSPESKMSEVFILEEALKNNDPTRLAELDIIAAGYRTIIEETLRVNTPVAFVRAHLDLLNAYEAILTDIRAMRLAFDDPLLSLARVNKYKEDGEAMATSLQTISKLTIDNSVTYSRNETGAMLYQFTQ